MTAKNEQFVSLGRCLGYVLRSSWRLLITLRLLLLPSAFISLQLHVVDLGIWQHAAVFAGGDTAVEHVVLRSDPVERVTGTGRRLVALLRMVFPLICHRMYALVTQKVQLRKCAI